MNTMNGAPKGANIINNQDSYDLVFKDIIVKSENRNKCTYPNPNTYSITLPEHMVKIYKAELIAVNVPAATDHTVNLSSTTNRLYFSYNDTSGNDPGSNNYGYIVLQAGTYLNPTGIANELQRKFNDAVQPNNTILAKYDTNLNRYLLRTKIGTVLTIFPFDGETCGSYTVQNSIGPSLKIPCCVGYNSTQPINFIDNIYGTVVISKFVDYGSYNEVPIDDQILNNTIASDTVLTDCSIYLSLGALNSNTIQFATDESCHGNTSIGSIFCEIPNNTSVSSTSNKTILTQPSVWSAMNFYNPPISNIRKIDIKWYDEHGGPINILEHCFTIRIYYFQKRNNTTIFSAPVLNY